MSPQEVNPPQGYQAGDYRRLLNTLGARARRLGSRDPEGAAQEALKRSLENTRSRPALEYYFSGTPAPGFEAPAWPLDHLLAWLHAVLRNVIREEQHRASFRHEVPSEAPEPADPAPDPLGALIQQEIHGVLRDGFQRLDRDCRVVLMMRAEGLKYSEIASRLGVNENTVATWISRGIRMLGQ